MRINLEKGNLSNLFTTLPSKKEDPETVESLKSFNNSVEENKTTRGLLENGFSTFSDWDLDLSSTGVEVGKVLNDFDLTSTRSMNSLHLMSSLNFYDETQETEKGTTTLQKLNSISKHHSKERKTIKKTIRTKHLPCSYNCGRFYSSEKSLRNHIRLKHTNKQNVGFKSFRRHNSVPNQFNTYDDINYEDHHRRMYSANEIALLLSQFSSSGRMGNYRSRPGPGPGPGPRPRPGPGPGPAGLPLCLRH